MEEESTSDNHLTPVVSKLINCIIVLVLLVVVLVVILLIYVPAPKEDVDTKIESPVPDKNGNFTEVAKKAAHSYNYNREIMAKSAGRQARCSAYESLGRRFEGGRSARDDVLTTAACRSH